MKRPCHVPGAIGVAGEREPRTNDRKRPDGQLGRKEIRPLRLCMNGVDGRYEVAIWSPQLDLLGDHVVHPRSLELPNGEPALEALIECRFELAAEGIAANLGPCQSHKDDDPDQYNPEADLQGPPERLGQGATRGGGGHGWGGAVRAGRIAVVPLGCVNTVTRFR